MKIFKYWKLILINLRRTIGKALYILYSASPKICYDIASWALKHGIRIIPLNKPAYERLYEIYAQYDTVLAQATVGYHRSTLSKSQCLVVLNGVSVAGKIGLVHLNDGQVVFEGNWWLPYLEAHPDYKRRFYFKSQKIEGNVYSLLCMWASSYYHWLIDVLPRLAAAIPYLPPDTKYLINENPNKWQIESLAAFGIEESRLVFQRDEMQSKLEHLWFATPVCQTGFATRETLMPVVARIKEFFGASEYQPSRKLYISRRKANRRRLLNEDEFLAKLLPHGFEVLFCEEMTPAEQVQAFAEAQTIIAPHGAGLTNLIFAAPGCKIYEINYSDKVYRGHYWLLSILLGHSFECLSAEKVNLSGEDFDLVANLSAIESVLK